MNYRAFPGNTDNYSILGFGCMRFPTIQGEGEQIDRERSEAMLDEALQSGVNYFDTAWPYHGGESEPFLGDFLEKRGIRDQVSIATKLPSWLIKKVDDPMRYFEQQLERLRTDRIDLYLLHALSRDNWDRLKRADIFPFMDRLKEEGLIGKIGFSFHDELSVFKEILDAYSWDFCQIQYNFLDTEYQAGLEGLKAAADKGMGIVVMEPLRGGSLAKNIPPDIEAIWSEELPRSAVDWALRYVWDDERVQVVLSGMSDLDQVKENIRIAGDVESGSLSLEDLDRYDRVASIYEKRQKARCTACRYCMPCPSGVDIPGVFRFLNNAFMFDDVKSAARAYGFNIKEDAGAQLCIACGQCEDACPQKLPIIELMKEADQVLG
jgi:uncharacterized protein